MGLTGPIPNKENDLARPRERKGADVQPVTHGTLLDVTIPNPDPEWHQVVRMAWDALATSGMRDFYQNTDWAHAYIVLNELDAYLRPGIDKVASLKASKEAGYDVVVRYPERRLSGMTFTSIMSALTSLGMTEGDRRRMRIELEVPKEEHDAQLYAIHGYKDMLDEDE